jgi:hypothetical protein
MWHLLHWPQPGAAKCVWVYILVTDHGQAQVLVLPLSSFMEIHAEFIYALCISSTWQLPYLCNRHNAFHDIFKMYFVKCKIFWYFCPRKCFFVFNLGNSCLNSLVVRLLLFSIPTLMYYVILFREIFQIPWSRSQRVSSSAAGRRPPTVQMTPPPHQPQYFLVSTACMQSCRISVSADKSITGPAQTGLNLGPMLDISFKPVW